MSKIVIKYNYKSNLKEFTMGFLWFGNKKKKNEKAVVTEPATNEQETPVAAKPDVVKSDTEVKPTVQDKPEEVKATVQAKPAVVKRTPKKSQVKTAPMTDDAEKKTFRTQNGQ